MNKKIYYSLWQLALFSTLLECGRILYTGNIGYVFLLWNLFLAIIPLVISYNLLMVGRGGKVENIFCFSIWLITLPNAPYLITDILHFGVNTRAPEWFDVMLLFSFALNGLLMGVVSMYFMKLHLVKYVSAKNVNYIMYICSIATGFGVYIGRYLRWNSWSIATHPFTLLSDCYIRIAHPLQHQRTWFVTFLFAVLIIWGNKFLENILQANNANK